MPYRSELLADIRFEHNGKWLDFERWVRSVVKKAHDREGSGYPLTVELKGSNNSLLLRQEFKNVWDRNPKSEMHVAAGEEWDLPVTVTVFRNGENYGSYTFEGDNVKVIESKRDHQMLIAEMPDMEDE